MPIWENNNGKIIINSDGNIISSEVYPCPPIDMFHVSIGKLNYNPHYCSNNTGIISAWEWDNNQTSVNYYYSYSGSKSQLLKLSAWLFYNEYSKYITYEIPENEFEEAKMLFEAYINMPEGIERQDSMSWFTGRYISHNITTKIDSNIGPLCVQYKICYMGSSNQGQPSIPEGAPWNYCDFAGMPIGGEDGGGVILQEGQKYIDGDICLPETVYYASIGQITDLLHDEYIYCEPDKNDPILSTTYKCFDQNNLSNAICSNLITITGAFIQDVLNAIQGFNPFNQEMRHSIIYYYQNSSENNPIQQYETLLGTEEFPLLIKYKFQKLPSSILYDPNYILPTYIPTLNDFTFEQMTNFTCSGCFLDIISGGYIVKYYRYPFVVVSSGGKVADSYVKNDPTLICTEYWVTSKTINRKINDQILPEEISYFNSTLIKQCTKEYTTKIVNHVAGSELQKSQFIVGSTSMNPGQTLFVAQIIATSNLDIEPQDEIPISANSEVLTRIPSYLLQDPPGGWDDYPAISQWKKYWANMPVNCYYLSSQFYQ